MDPGGIPGIPGMGAPRGGCMPPKDPRGAMPGMLPMGPMPPGGGPGGNDPKLGGAPNVPLQGPSDPQGDGPPGIPACRQGPGGRGGIVAIASASPTKPPLFSEEGVV
mmetsp:Transcript_60855/g.145048  ORF Transcript_60855/g.145048 Transcript_60855/m.145048 type:complete len:107 (-) Transcript_60855:37-357(-)